MILDKINSPTDLRELSLADLKNLSQEVRDLIIEVVSKKGGHLGSSLGAVELCLALHYCYHTPQDSLIFDVGHQTYAHKIVTGRKSVFKTLREYKGISGFPNFKESPYDVYISGHASTAISWAQGVAEAKRLKADNTKTVAVIGDGSLTGGLCYEALNSCGHCQSDVLVVLNHNEMSISPSVGAMSRYLTRIISAPMYNRLKNEVENFLNNIPLAKKLIPKARKFEESVKGLIVPGMLFEEMGFRYFGPINGHNLDMLVPTLKNIASLKGPKILHVVTKKGKGYKFAEEKPEDFHGISSFNVEDGESTKAKKESFSISFAKKALNLAKENDKIIAVTAAMPNGTGLDIFAKELPKRFYDVGIAEPHAVSFASGLAKEGLKPIVAIYSTFLQRAYDQIIHDVALQDLGVVFAIDRAGVVGEDGPTHHGVFDIGYLRLIPNMVSMAPKDKAELEKMLEFATANNFCTSIRYPRGVAYSLGYDEEVVLGKSQVLHKAKDVCIIALGPMVKVALGALNHLKEEGLDATVVNARFIKPLDEELLKNLAKDHRQIITIEDGVINTGFGSAVLEFYQSQGLLDKVGVTTLGFPDEFIPAGDRGKLLDLYGLSENSLTAVVNKLLKR